MLKINKNKILINLIMCVLLLSIICINYLSMWNVKLIQIYAIITLLFSVYFVYLLRNSTALIVLGLFVLHCNYSIVFGVYFDWNVPMFMYKQITSIQTYGLTLGMLLFTMVVVCIGLYNKSIENSSKLFMQKNKNTLLFFCIEIILILIPIFNIDFQVGVRQFSSIFEYSAIIFVILIYYSGDDKILKTISIATVLIFSLIAYLMGNRIEMISFLLVLYFAYYSDRFKIKTAIIVTIAGLLLMEIMGYVRSGYYDYEYAIEQIKTLKFEQQTSVNAYFPTLAVVESRGNDGIWKGLENLWQYVKYILLGSNKVPDFYITINIRKQGLYNHIGGTLSFAVFYYWLKEIGVFIYGVVFGKVLKGIHKDSRYKQMLSIYLCATCPRWYLYGPGVLTRGALMFSVAYFVSIFLAEKIIGKKR